jgi:hypothetical protein
LFLLLAGSVAPHHHPESGKATLKLFYVLFSQISVSTIFSFALSNCAQDVGYATTLTWLQVCDVNIYTHTRTRIVKENLDLLLADLDWCLFLFLFRVGGY